MGRIQPFICAFFFNTLTLLGWGFSAPSGAGDIPVASSSVAPDCGTSIRLDAPGGPLEDADVQAQDGLGTCASNALSLMLEGTLPGHPEVSFLDIAFHDKDVGDRALVDPAVLKPGVSPSPGVGASPPELAFTGAHICDQFEALKNAGGACSRRRVALEVAAGEAKSGTPFFRADDLQRALEGIGRLFDAGLGTPEGNLLWESEIQPLLENSEEQVLEACSGRLQGEEGLAGVLGELASEVQVQLEAQKDALSRQEREVADLTQAGNLEGAAAVGSVLEISRRNVAQLQDTLRWLESPPISEIESAFYSRYQRSRSQFDRRAHLDDSFEVFDERINSLIASWLRQSIPEGAPVSDQLLTEFLEFSPDSVRKIRIQLLVAADPKSCAIQGYSFLKTNPKLPGTCPGGEMRDPVLELLAAYVDIGLNSRGLVQGLPRMRSSEDATDWFMRTLAPGCISPHSRIPIDPALSCQSGEWSPPKAGELNDPQARQKSLDAFSLQMRAGLMAGRPQGISMCSAVLRDFSFDGKHDLNDGCSGATALPGHGHHAVVVIGLRETPDSTAPGGCKREVLVQNSWGMDWCSSHNAGISREEDQPCQDGKLWMPEEALAKNTYLVSEIEALPAKGMKK